MISISDFDKVELRVGTVTQVGVNKKARKPAYKVTIDFGDVLGLKTSSAQITELYRPEELIGRQVVCCVNLEPMHIGSVKSEVRIMGTESEQGVVLLTRIRAGSSTAYANGACKKRRSCVLMKQKGNNGYLLVFFAGVLWGTIGLFVKQLQRCGASPMETAFLRVFFAFLMMLALCVFHSGWRSLKTDKRTTGVCILLGVVCHGVYNIFYSFAVTMAGVSVSAVLLNIAPVFTLLCSGLCFGERITKRKLIAIAVNILGCVLTVTNGKLNILLESDSHNSLGKTNSIRNDGLSRCLFRITRSARLSVLCPLCHISYSVI